MKGETLPPAGRFNGIPCMQEPEPIRETHSLVRTFTRLKPMPQQRANAPAA